MSLIYLTLKELIVKTDLKVGNPLKVLWLKRSLRKLFKTCFIDDGSMGYPQTHIFFSFMKFIYMSKKYTIVKALEL